MQSKEDGYLWSCQIAKGKTATQEKITLSEGNERTGHAGQASK